VRNTVGGIGFFIDTKLQLTIVRTAQHGALSPRHSLPKNRRLKTVLSEGISEVQCSH
jgi:hypothetical protein